MLEGKTNHQVIEKSTVSDTITYLKTTDEVDLIICDISLPDGSGSEVYEYVREKNIDIPFIATTGHNFIEEGVFENFSKDNKYNTHLSKPFDFADLRDLVIEALDSKLETPG